MIDTRVITNATADTNTQGQRIYIKKAIAIRAHPDNAGLVWVSFGREATDGGCWPLNIGDGVPIGIDGFEGITNFDQLHFLFKNGGDKVTVLFEG